MTDPWAAIPTLTEDPTAADRDPSMPCMTGPDRVNELAEQLESLESSVAQVALELAQENTRLQERVTALQARYDHLADTIAEWEADS